MNHQADERRLRLKFVRSYQSYHSARKDLAAAVVAEAEAAEAGEEEVTVVAVEEVAAGDRLAAAAGDPQVEVDDLEVGVAVAAVDSVEEVVKNYRK